MEQLSSQAHELSKVLCNVESADSMWLPEETSGMLARPMTMGKSQQRYRRLICRWNWNSRRVAGGTVRVGEVVGYSSVLKEKEYVGEGSRWSS